MDNKIKVSNAARINIKAINNTVLDFTAVLRDVSTDMYDICLKAGFPECGNGFFVSTDHMCSDVEDSLSDTELNLDLPGMMKMLPLIFLRVLAEMMFKIGPEIDNYLEGNDKAKSGMPNLSIIKNQKPSHQQNETSNTEESGEDEILKEYFQEIEFIKRTFDYLLYQYDCFLGVDEQNSIMLEFDESLKREILNNITNMNRVNLSIEILFTGLNVLVNSINQIRMAIREKKIDDKTISNWRWGGINL